MVLTISVTIVSGDFLSHTHRPNNAESNIFPFAEKFGIIVAVVLKSQGVSATAGRIIMMVAYVHKTRRPQEQMVLLHLFRVNDAEIPANRYTISMPPVCPFEFLILLVGQICHGPLELRDDHAWVQGPCGEDAQLGLAGSMGVAGCMRNLYGASREVQFEIAGSVAAGGHQVSLLQDVCTNTHVAKAFICFWSYCHVFR